jgi:MFS transporter, FHS family, glucose/mannose:H+ symporter
MPEFVKSRVVSVGGIGHNVGPAMNPIDAPGENMPRRRTAIGTLHVGFVLTGVVTTLLGPILPLLIARWSLSDARAGLFFTLQFCGNLVGIASLGALLSRRGYRLTFFLGFSFMSVGILALVPISELVGMIATALFGYGLGLVLSGTNLWVAEITRSRRAAALSVLNLAWGLGAILCPALVMFAQKEHELLSLLVGIAAFSGLIALVLAAIDIEPRFERSENSEPEHRLEVANKPTLVVLGGLFFLYVGTEASVGGWAASLAKRTVTTSGDLWALSPMFFWFGLLAGRALTPAVLLRVSETSLAIGGLILAAIGTGLLLWVRTFQSAAISVAVSGLGLSSIYPLLVAWMVGYYGTQARRFGSILFGLAALGGATMPWLVGFASTEAGSLRTGLFVPLVGCLIMISLVSIRPGHSVS